MPPLEYIVLVLYFAALFTIGGLASRHVKNLNDYYVGGKRLNFWLVAFSARATGESVWLFLGLTGLGAMVGLSAMWIVVGEVLGVAIGWFLMAVPFKRATDQFKSLTVPDYLVSVFDEGTPLSQKRGKQIRLLAAGALSIFVTIYISAQIDATGKAFNSFLEWDYYAGVLIGFGIVVLYTFGGGFIAVTWSDLFQGAIMLIGLVLIPVVALLKMPPDVQIMDALASLAPGFTNIWGAGGLTADNFFLLISYVAIGLGFLGSPQVFVRFMSIRHVSEIKRGRWVAVLFTVLTDTGAVWVGILGRYLLVGPAANAEAVLGNAAEQVLPALVDHLFPPLIAGLYIAAVLAAIMSTIDSLLVVASSAVTHDYYRKIRHKPWQGETLTRLSRRVTLVIALSALAVALTVSFLSPTRTIFWFVIFGWSGIAATFCPAIILSLFWKGYTATGALASMIVGFISIPLFKFAAPLLPGIGHAFGLMGEMAPSFATALIAGIVVSKLYPN